MIKHKHCNCRKCRDKTWENRKKELMIGIVSEEEIKEIEAHLDYERCMVDPEFAADKKE